MSRTDAERQPLNLSVESLMHWRGELAKAREMQLRLAEHLFDAACVLGRLAERRTAKLVLTETDYCPLA